MEEKKSWYEDIPAPVDADGNVVPLTTRKLYCEDGREVAEMLRDRLARMHKPACDRVGPGLVAAEMRMTAGRLHEMADQAEAGRNDVRVDVPGFHALAYYLESWSLSIDQTCDVRIDAVRNELTCSRCGSKWPRSYQTYDGHGGWHDVRYCPNCGARVVRFDG